MKPVMAITFWTILGTFTFLIFSCCFGDAAIIISHDLSTPMVEARSIPLRQGWTANPEGRGTLNILWSCGSTMILCSWSLLCLNVPEPNDSKFQIFRRKIYVTTLCFLGPEFIFMIALGQWKSARRSVRDFRNSGFNNWTMKHAHFADMGGFILHTRDWTPFPVDARQLHYLILKGYVKHPEKIDEKRISDKNKVDGLLRAITLIQISWFTVNLLGRAAQHLTITCLELTTASFIVCSVATSICWLHKPADVVTSEDIVTHLSMAEILLRAGEHGSGRYSHTPLDFISREEWPWSKYWTNWINILRNMHIIFGPRVRPVNRFENTTFLPISRHLFLVVLLLYSCFCAIFFCGWNFTFPTGAEQILWRSACVVMFLTIFAYEFITEVVFFIYPTLRRAAVSAFTPYLHGRRSTSTRRWMHDGRLSRKAKSIAACIRNNSISQDPTLTIPLKAILPMYCVGFLYCNARTYLYIADLIELRSLPPAAYSTVNWLEFIPHF
jgi:hypothetical protein